jgi:hypothetical protein
MNIIMPNAYWDNKKNLRQHFFSPINVPPTTFNS